MFPLIRTRNICINHLREIRVAKLLWQRNVLEAELEQGMTNPILVIPEEVPGYWELQLYFPHGLAPFCPDDESHFFQTSYVIRVF